MNIGSVVSYITNNWQDMMLIVTTIVTVASLIAKMTPTKADDVIVDKVIGFLNILAINKKRG